MKYSKEHVWVKGEGGTITVGDAQTAFYIALQLHEPTYDEACSADCDGSGNVTVGDAQTIFYQALGIGGNECIDSRLNEPLK